MAATQSALSEKREELLKVETMLRDVEDKYYSSTVTIQDKTTQDLRVCIETSITAGQ